MPVTIRCLTLSTLAALLVACSQPTIKEQPSPEFATEGLHPVRSSGFNQAFVRPDAGLSSYRAVAIPAMQVADVEVTRTAVAGTVRSDWQMTPERENNLQQLWRNATDRVFSDYGDSDSAGKVLRIEAALTQVIPGRSSGTGTTAGGGVTAGSADSVDIAAEFRLYDQASGDLLAVIRDRRTLPGIQWTRSAGLDMANQFSTWAGLLHTRLSGR